VSVCTDRFRNVSLSIALDRARDVEQRLFLTAPGDRVGVVITPPAADTSPAPGNRKSFNDQSG